jgi:ribose-phosphate pyrophosphokinase
LIEQQDFASGEFALNLSALDDLSGVHALIIHAATPNVHASLMWLFFLMHALAVRSISVSLFMPYMVYARQEQALCAIDQMLHLLEVQSLSCIELHSPSAVSSMRVPTHNILLHSFIAHFLQDRYSLDQLTIIAPDKGAVARAQAIADQLQVPLVICTKQRDVHGVTVTGVIGLCNTPYAVIIDDIIDTGATLKDVATAVRNQNSSCIIDAFAVHGLLSTDALSTLSNSTLRKLYITNTIEHQQALPNTIEIVDVVDVLVNNLF